MVMRKTFWTIGLVDASLFALESCISSVLRVCLIPSVFIQLSWLDQLAIVMVGIC